MTRRLIHVTRTTPSQVLTWLLVLPASVSLTITFWLAGYGPVVAPDSVAIAASLGCSMLFVGWIFSRATKYGAAKLDVILYDNELARQRAENTGVWASAERSLAIRWDREGRCFRVRGHVPSAGVWAYLPDEQAWRNFETLGQVVRDAEAAGMVASPDIATTVVRARALFVVMTQGWNSASGMRKNQEEHSGS